MLSDGIKATPLLDIELFGAQQLPLLDFRQVLMAVQPRYAVASRTSIKATTS
jgi:hypothetical protein